MNAFENATKFFHSCEGLKGRSATMSLVADGAEFVSQAKPLNAVKTVANYVDWMHGIATTALIGATYDLNASSWDAENRTALFFGTFYGRHTSEGGPVPPTMKATASHYVYAIEMNEGGKVARMTKIWNASWSMRELGWE